MARNEKKSQSINREEQPSTQPSVRRAIASPLLYLALGDSLTAGAGSLGAVTGFVRRYHRYSTQAINQRIFPQVVARHGMTTSDLLDMIRQPQVQGTIEQADIITISAGQNDFILAFEEYKQDKKQNALKEAFMKSKKNIAEIVREIKKRKEKKDAPYLVRMLDLYNPYKEEALAEKWVNHYNLHLRNLATYPFEVTDTYSAFKGREETLLSRNGVYPNVAGYQVIAEELNKLGYTPLAKELNELN